MGKEDPVGIQKNKDALITRLAEPNQDINILNLNFSLYCSFLPSVTSGGVHLVFWYFLNKLRQMFQIRTST